MAKYEIKDGVGIIPPGTTIIEDEAFKGCDELKSIVIPDSVTKIGSHAFRWCTGLTEVIIPDSVTTICDGAFVACTGLKELVIPNSVTKIGSDAFQACFKLTSVTISESVSYIGYGAFSTIVDLASIIVSEGNKVYDSRDNCNAIIETSTNTLIAGCRNTLIPDSVTKIGPEAFLGCYGLSEFAIPENITEIGRMAFYGAQLTSIVISGKVKEIGEWAFRECPNLSDVIIGDDVELIGDYAFSGCPQLKRLALGNSVVKIGENAFSECTSLINLVIPDSVTEIHDYAFSGCTSLSSIRLSDCEMGSWVFAGCMALRDIAFLESVTMISVSAFQQCTGLTNVVIPDSVTQISTGAFNGCTGLTSVTIPDSVTKIGDDAFRGCMGLTSIVIPDSVTAMGGSSFGFCSSLQGVVLSNSLTKIEDRTFFGCTSLTGIDVPHSVTEIETYAFKGCTALESITLPEMVTYISRDAFDGCTSLSEIGVPANKYGYFKKQLPKELHTLLVRKPVSKKPKKKCTIVDTSNMTEEGRIVLKVRSLTYKVMSQLRAEKRSTGDYSKSVMIDEDGYKFKFDACQYRDGSYPPVSVKLSFIVSVYREDELFMGCEVNNEKHALHYFRNSDGKYAIYAWKYSEKPVEPLFRSGDTICFDNNGKAAYAKAEILSEETKYWYNGLMISYITRRLRLTKELGHSETLACSKGYPAQVVTYIADDSTEEYFAGKDIVEKDIEVRVETEERESGGLYWNEYSCEEVSRDSAVQLAIPYTAAEMTLHLKQEALKELLRNCRDEFCYYDPIVNKYRKYYHILGEENIDTIYTTYMKWLRNNCTTYVQDVPSSDSSGIAIDWNGKEDSQPVFDVSGEVVKIKL